MSKGLYCLCKPAKYAPPNRVDAYECVVAVQRGPWGALTPQLQPTIRCWIRPTWYDLSTQPALQPTFFQLVTKVTAASKLHDEKNVVIILVNLHVVRSGGGERKSQVRSVGRGGAAIGFPLQSHFMLCPLGCTNRQQPNDILMLQAGENEEFARHAFRRPHVADATLLDDLNGDLQSRGWGRGARSGVVPTHTNSNKTKTHGPPVVFLASHGHQCTAKHLTVK
jgi:hypothetical protein